MCNGGRISGAKVTGQDVPTGSGDVDAKGAGDFLEGEDTGVEVTGNPSGAAEGEECPEDEPIQAVTLMPTPGKEPGSNAGHWKEWGFAGVGFAAGLAFAMASVGISKIFHTKAKERTEKAPAREKRGIVVEKLHEQGARKSQQDSFSVSQEELAASCGILAVVADGMGGLANGDKVSQTAVATVMNHFYTMQGKPQEVLLGLLKLANGAVNAMLGAEGLRKSGSTLVMGLIQNGTFHYLSVGDSRICLYRGGVLYQLNRDHVYQNELYIGAVNGAEEIAGIKEHPGGGGLTSFLGMGQLKYIDLPAQPVAIREGDIFLLMSDGVYNALPEAELAGLLNTKTGAADAIRAAIQAKAYANQDNYTAVILRC